jgi:cobalt-precorrin 5A hydrolase
MLYVAGLGCRRGCPLAQLRELLLQTLNAHNLQPTELRALASSSHKHGEPALLQLAAELQLPLHWLSAEQLKPYELRLSQHSALSQQMTGSSGVAEASALALSERLSHSQAELLGPRRHNRNATCAIAAAPTLEFA